MNIWIHARRFRTSIVSAGHTGEDEVIMATHAADSSPRSAASVRSCSPRQQIAARVAEIGAQIDHDFAGESVLLVGVLKGAAIFLSDLARAISIQCTFDFVAVSSYGKGTRSSGAVKLIKDLDHSD